MGRCIDVNVDRLIRRDYFVVFLSFKGNLGVFRLYLRVGIGFLVLFYFIEG